MIKDLGTILLLLALACVVVSIPYSILILGLGTTVIEASSVVYGILAVILILIRVVGTE